MGPLHEKKIILAVCGSIAAYKAALLTRLLIKAGADVQVLMTDAATGFVSTLTFSTLSKRPVFTSVHSEHGWNNHVDLGLWADAFLIAPATATTLGKLAHGIADNMVVATYLSARCPVFFAPAMDLDMWQHPSTQANVQRLQSYGDTLIPVEHGELASGLVGPGRMAEPEAIVEFLAASLAADQPLAGYRVMITAGPTYEPIDPVRFIGNHSSGKMGLAIAEDLAARGAQVDLILGPSVLEVSHPNIRVHRVKTGQKMFEQAKAVFPKAQIAVFAAAVADYRPKEVAEEKIKKQSDQLTIELEKTIDIAATLGKMKGPDQVSVGFALETEHAEAYAQSKLERKNFDLIVLNSLRDAGAGFQHDTNKITIFHRGGERQDFDLKSKKAVAKDIGTAILRYIPKKGSFPENS